MNRFSSAKWSALKTYKHMIACRLNKIYLGIYMQTPKHICMQFLKRRGEFEESGKRYMIVFEEENGMKNQFTISQNWSICSLIWY